MFEKPRRKVSKVFIHCSASDYKSHDNVGTIRHWHRERGFSDIGYHYIITRNGKLHKGRSLELIPAAQKNHNTGSIAICVTGLTWFTILQMQTLIGLCIEINNPYKNYTHAGLTFHGHTEVNPNKSCPVFNYRAVLQLTDDGCLREDVQWLI